MTESTTVTVSGYAYSVTDAQGKVNTVCKDRTCSCGKENCWHVRQVRLYLNKGGAKAPDAPEVNTEHLDALFTGNENWHSVPHVVTPYQSPYTLRYWAERAAKLKTLKTKMDSDGEQNKLDAVGQYWFDLAHMTTQEVQDKWRLNEPEFSLCKVIA